MQQFHAFHHPDDIQAYQSGEVIFKQGADGDFMYDILEGEVQLSRHKRELIRLQEGEVQLSRHKRELIRLQEGEVQLSRHKRELIRLQEGEIFGETGLINHEPHSVTATAVASSV